MRFALWIALHFIFVFASVEAYAQIDPSSALLLNSGAPANNRDSGVDSGRYTVRPSATPVKSSSHKVVEVVDDSADDDTPAPTPAPVSAATPAPAVPAPAARASVVNLVPPPSSVGGAGAAPAILTPDTRPIVQNNSIDTIVDSRRLMLLELTVGSGYMYNGSQSDYAFRNYSTSSPILSVDGRVWITPGFAIQSGFVGTLSGNLSDSFDGSRSVSASQQWFSTGIRSRKFFGSSHLAPTLELGIDYLEYTLDIPTDAVIREKLKSTGLLLSVESQIPTSAFTAWTLGFQFAPKLQHSESATGVTFSSGGNVDANSVGVSFGQKIGFDRSNSMFWKISYSVEKDLFSGAGDTADPLTGKTPSGVSVTNSWSMLQFGFSWGD